MATSAVCAAVATGAVAVGTMAMDSLRCPEPHAEVATLSGVWMLVGMAPNGTARIPSWHHAILGYAAISATIGLVLHVLDSL